MASAGLGGLTLPDPPDYPRFAQLADAVRHGQLAAAYRTDWNQAGPLQLIVARLLLIGGSGAGFARPTVILGNITLMLAVLWLCRGGDEVAGLRRQLLAGGCTLLWFAVGQPWNGHPAELLIPLGWFAGLRLQERGRWWWAAIALGSTVAIAPWGVLAFPGLLAVSSLPRALRTGWVGAAVAVACYLPFVLSGRFALFRHRWLIDEHSLVHLVDPAALYASWPLRLAQAVIVAGGCALVGLRARGRGRADAAMLALLAAGLLRISCDPMSFSYYWLSVAVFAILLIAQSADRLTPRGMAPAVAVAYLSWAASSIQHQWLGAVLCLFVLGWQLRAGGETVVRPAVVALDQVDDDVEHGVPAHA